MFRTVGLIVAMGLSGTARGFRAGALASVCILLACGSVALGADPPATTTSTPAAAPNVLNVAKSALLSIDATTTGDSLALHIRRVRDRTPVTGDDVTVTVDGKPEPVTRASDGSYQLAAAALRGDGQHDVEIIVGHDGIREVLSGRLSLPEPTSAGSLFRDHKQVAWWILNIVVVLIAALALSRRKG